MTISFTDETIIEPVEEEDPLIPMNKFEFVTLEDLYNLASETSTGVDVLGVVEDERLTVRSVTTKFGEKKQLKFKISNGRLEKKSQNTPSTKRIQSLQHPRTKVQYEIMDLKKLMSIKDEAYIDKEVQCHAKICKVKEDSSWWYKSCIFCKADVKQLDEEFKCTSCPKSMPSPEKRFRILVLVEDEVEARNLLLLDRVATRIVNLEDESKELQGLPKKLKDIVGKEYTFIIKFFKENILNDCGLYYASDVSFSSRKRNQTVSTDDFKGTGKRPYGVSHNIPHSHSSLQDKENVSPNCNPADRNLDKVVQRPLKTSPLIDYADFQQTILDTSQMRAPPGLCQYFQDPKNKNNIKNTFRGTTTFSGQSEELMTRNRDRQKSDTNAMKNLMHSFNHVADNSELNQEQEVLGSRHV
ncbi:hypothetical protein POM88_040963 [Heracleum sosnowskyi]|uniref:Replication factor A C-terminal domain-containing protein n=1 Tax=Heracleum sosnowskyi TaxID=360622 RepID=A0AAD8MAC4_9APIA|nr:hypothetical protein POM88_040963 [Heracleum sosnowskyi]